MFFTTVETAGRLMAGVILNKSVKVFVSPVGEVTEPKTCAAWATSPFLNLIEFCINNGFDINSADPLYGYTIFHFLARYGAGLELMVYLAKKYKVDLNIQYVLVSRNACFPNVILPLVTRKVTRRSIWRSAMTTTSPHRR